MGCTMCKYQAVEVHVEAYGMNSNAASPAAKADPVATPNYGARFRPVLTSPEHPLQDPVATPNYAAKPIRPTFTPQAILGRMSNSPGPPLESAIAFTPQGTTQAIEMYQDCVLADTNEKTFRYIRQLGQGGLGIVSLCERSGDKIQKGLEMPDVFALKELISPKAFPIGEDEDLLKYLPLNEAANQRYLRHSNIVKLYWADVRYLHPVTGESMDIGVRDLLSRGRPRESLAPLDRFKDVKTTLSRSSRLNAFPFGEVKLQMRIAMEICDLGSLFDYLMHDDKPQRRVRTFAHTMRKLPSANTNARAKATMAPQRSALNTALDIAEALKFMHKSKTLHGDLKPQNILLVSVPTAGDHEPDFRAKLTDFGTSQHMAENETRVYANMWTEAYLAPEFWDTRWQTEKTDVYALGLIMWEIYHGVFWHALYRREKRKVADEAGNECEALPWSPPAPTRSEISGSCRATSDQTHRDTARLHQPRKPCPARLPSRLCTAYVFHSVEQNESISKVDLLFLPVRSVEQSVTGHAQLTRRRAKFRAKSAREMRHFTPACNCFCPPPYASLVNACLHSEATQRPTAAEVVARLNEIIAASDSPD